MTIDSNDIKLYNSENMTDTDQSGGYMGNTTVDCASPMNNLFGNITRIDRLYGRIQLRKVWIKVDSDNTDVYGGSHFVVKLPPDDENVSIILFNTDDNAQIKGGAGGMQEVLESYTIDSGIPYGDAVSAYPTNAGDEKMIFKASEIERYKEFVVTYDGNVIQQWKIVSEQINTLSVSVGDIVVIVDGVKTEFRQINKVETIIDDITYNEGRVHRIIYKAIYFSDTLEYAHDAGKTLNQTTINPSWKCYGHIKLGQDASPFDTVLRVDTSKVRLIPTILNNIVIEDYAPFPLASVIDNYWIDKLNKYVNGILQPWYSDSLLVSEGQTNYNKIMEYGPIKVGTLVIKVRVNNKWEQLQDDGTGTIDGYGTGTIDLDTDLVSINLDNAPDIGTHLIYEYQSEVGFTEQENIPCGNPGNLPIPLDFGMSSINPGSILLKVSLTSGGPYNVIDNGNGVLQWDKRTIIGPGDDQGSNYDNRTYNLYKTYYHKDTFFVPDTQVPGQYTKAPRVYSGSNGYDYVVVLQKGDQIDGQSFGYWVEQIRGMYYDSVNDKQFVFGTSQSTTEEWGVIVRDGTAGVWSHIDLKNASGWVAGEWADVRGAAQVNGRIVLVSRENKVMYSDDYSNWTVSAQIFGYTLGGAAEGTDENGDDVIIVWTLNTSILYYSSDGQTYTAKNTGITGDITGVSCNKSNNTWMLTTTNNEVLRSTDGGKTWSTLLSKIIDSIPDWGSVTTANFGPVFNNGQKTFVVPVKSANNYPTTAKVGIVLYTNDNGETWLVEQVFSPFYSNIDLGVRSGAYSPDGIFSFSGTYGINGSFVASNVTDMSGFPDVAGDFNYTLGTGNLTSTDGTDVISSIIAEYFSIPRTTKNFSVVLAGDNLVLNTFLAKAKKATDLSDIQIEEVGGVLTGDGNGFLDKENGYAIISFNDSVAVDSFLVDYIYGGYTYPIDYDQINTGKFPPDGMVPAFKKDDLAILNDGVNVEAVIIQSVYHDRIIIANQLSNSFSAANTTISNAIVKGDLQASYDTWFTQQTWDGSTYSDTQIGNPADGTYDHVTYPVIVTNHGAEDGKWAIEITSVIDTDTFVVSVNNEHLGVVQAGITVGDGGANIAITNPNTGAVYFTLSNAGWGIGWQVGNIIRFNTIEAGAPLWIARVINARASDTTDDSSVFEIRGDVAS